MPRVHRLVLGLVCGWILARLRLVPGDAWLAGPPEAPLCFASAVRIAELGPTGLTAKVLRAAFARAAAR